MYDMKPNTKKLFSLTAPEVPVSLSGNILKAVRFEQSRLLRRRVLLTRAGVFISLALCGGMLFVVASDFWGSEFFNLFSVLLSNSSELPSVGMSLSFALLEAFPAFSFFLLLLAFVALCVSLRVYIHSLKNPFTRISIHSLSL